MSSLTYIITITRQTQVTGNSVKGIFLVHVKIHMEIRREGESRVIIKVQLISVDLTELSNSKCQCFNELLDTLFTESSGEQQRDSQS